jgi:hypothetical protein
VRIIWNLTFKQFEAQLSNGEQWAQDQQAVKMAGFKTEGPPDWKWVAFRAAVLTKLKSAKPASGITITPDALMNYQRLKTLEDANAVVKAQLKAARKEQQIEDPAKGFKMTMGPEGFMIADVEPGESKIWNKYIPPDKPAMLCHICQSAVYFYECQNPPTCLDCEFELGL